MREIASRLKFQRRHFAPICYGISITIYLGLAGVFWVGEGLAQEHILTPSERVTRFVNVRVSPSAGSKTIKRLRLGESLPYVRSIPRWHEVKVDGDLTGFVSKSWTIISPPLPTESTELLRIHFLSVGAGTCTVVECPGANAPPMIIDCGSSAGSRGAMALEQDKAQKVIHEILARHSVPPNVILSHGDIDHYNWIPHVLDGITTQNIWQGGTTTSYGSGSFPKWLQAQRSEGASIHAGFPAHWHNQGKPLGESLSCGLASTYILSVNDGGSKNANSLVLMIEYGDFTTIFTGDAEKTTEDSAAFNFH